MTPDSLMSALSDFEKCGLLAYQSTGYVYAPNNAALRDAFEQTARAYSERRVAVINQIFSSPLKSLSDAFKLRSEE